MDRTPEITEVQELKWPPRRGRPRDGEESALPAGELDALSWETLRQSVIGAHDGDPEAHTAPLLRYERQAPLDMKAGIYLRYLLRYRVAELLGRSPSPDDLRTLADRFQSKFARLIRGDRRQLEDTLLSVHDLAVEGRKVAGGKGVLWGSAALGVLLSDPEADLAVMRPHVTEWWQRNAAEFCDLGVS